MKYLLDGESTSRLHFRAIKESDFDTWLQFFKDPITREHWKGEFGQPESECRKWYDKQFHRYQNDLGGMNALIEKVSGNLVGHCGIALLNIDHKWEFEIGYSLLPRYWGQGFAIEAALKCRDFAFENNFSDSIISIISHTNVPSQKVALKNGMTNTKSTVYAENDVFIYRITKTDWEDMKIQ